MHSDMLPKGAMAARLRRELIKDQDKALEFKGLVGNEAKAQFRQNWANEKLKAARRKLDLLKEQSLQQSEEVHGTYLPFRRIWDQEGADMEGYMALRGQSPSASVECTSLHVCFAVAAKGQACT